MLEVNTFTHEYFWAKINKKFTLGYQPQLQETPTLQLNDLTRPGNYTFKLTVTDTDKNTSTSTANVTVLKITDYPPEANAGKQR